MKVLLDIKDPEQLGKLIKLLKEEDLLAGADLSGANLRAAPTAVIDIDFTKC